MNIRFLSPDAQELETQLLQAVKICDHRYLAGSVASPPPVTCHVSLRHFSLACYTGLTMKKKSESIEKILKRYKNEWLLIKPDVIEHPTLKPKTGWLIQHSPRKEDLTETFIHHKGHLYRIFSGPILPAGFRAAY